MTVIGESSSRLEMLVSEIADLSAVSAPRPDLAKARRRLSTLSRTDYAAALGRMFNRQQMREIVKELRSFLPDLNREVFSETDVRRLALRAKDFGAVLQPRKFEGDEGRSLRGFYVNDRSVLSRPLIVLNTASHRVAVAAAFWHEMGHHLTHAIFGAAEDDVTLHLAATPTEHLHQPEEIVADCVTTLACYPTLQARRIFGAAAKRKPAADPDALAPSLMPYVRKRIGFNFNGSLSPAENLQSLAGIIHIAKLRKALLDEYGI